uniref:CRAL-TRIO domain-containing protein n=1 Tax=Polytomella parva TaxID=51329 RepID=A0A7S0UWT5_9CHLO|mmetsp:Transcript_24859/g.44885  ORF Transcript_24859/g.44885 Transcript_24859/m.44885 type:complete len:774 (+) Transcript_24859:124-2445(+)
MPKAPPPNFPLRRFQGRIEWPIEKVIDDWGLNPEQQEAYVEEFRSILEELGAWNYDEHDYYTLRRFLRARTYDFERAKKMWLDHLAWREAHDVDSLLNDFFFEERAPFLKVYPQGYHKTDKLGRPVYIQLLGQINVPEIKKVTDEDRMFKFHIQEYERCVKVILPICSKMQQRSIDTTFGIMDVKGVGLSALTGEIKGMLTKFTKTDQDNYPEMAGHICIINAPTVFRMIWNFVKGLIDPRTQQKIEILGSDYLTSLKKWIDIEDIPTFLGGKSKGSLVDDEGPWNDEALLEKLDIDAAALKHGVRIHEAVRTKKETNVEMESTEAFEDGESTVKRMAGAVEEVVDNAEETMRETNDGRGGGGESEVALPKKTQSTNGVMSQVKADGKALVSPSTISPSTISSSALPPSLTPLPPTTASVEAVTVEHVRVALGSSAASSHPHPHPPLLPATGLPPKPLLPPAVAHPPPHSTSGDSALLLLGASPSLAGAHPSKGSITSHHHPSLSANGILTGSSSSASGAARTKTLIERIYALERRIPVEDLEKFRSRMQASGEAVATASSRSAPEGSLLGRIEVLEEALDMLMFSQEVAMAAAKEKEKEKDRDKDRDKKKKTAIGAEDGVKKTAETNKEAAKGDEEGEGEGEEGKRGRDNQKKYGIDSRNREIDHGRKDNRRNSSSSNNSNNESRNGHHQQQQMMSNNHNPSVSSDKGANSSPSKASGHSSQSHGRFPPSQGQSQQQEQQQQGVKKHPEGASAAGTHAPLPRQDNSTCCVVM